MFLATQMLTAWTTSTPRSCSHRTHAPSRCHRSRFRSIERANSRMDTEWIISVSFVPLQSCILHRSLNSRSYKISHFLLHSLSGMQHFPWSCFPRPSRLSGVNSNQFSCFEKLETCTCNEKTNDIVVETFRLTEPYYTDRYRFLLFRLSSWSGLFELIEVWNHKHGIPRNFSVYES